MLLFGLINPVFAEIKGTDLSGRTDGSICSWFQVKNTPQIYIDEARKRNLACGIPLNARQTDSGWKCWSGFKQSGNKCLKINSKHRVKSEYFEYQKQQYLKNN